MEQRDKNRKGRMKGKSKAGKAKKADTRKKAVKKGDESRAPVVSSMAMVRQYFREVVYEMRKVIWPTRKETIASTAVVLVIVMICGIYLGIVDFILNRFVQLLIG